MKHGTLAEERPDLAAEWHPTKNDKTPNEVTLGSNYIAWWTCSKGHEDYTARVATRALNGTGCDKCGRARAPINMTSTRLAQNGTLLHRYPVLVRDHWSTTNILLPTQVGAFSEKCAYWKCHADHILHIKISTVTTGYTKSGKYYCSTCASLSFAYPEIAREWDYSRNEDTPDVVKFGTEKKRWFICPSGHSYAARVDSRVRNGTGCPQCNRGWTIDNLRHFVKEMGDCLSLMTPSQIHVICRDRGISTSTHKGPIFVELLTRYDGMRSPENLKLFAKGEPSILEQRLLAAKDFECPTGDEVLPSGILPPEVQPQYAIPTEEEVRQETRRHADAMARYSAKTWLNDGERADHIIRIEADRMWKRAYLYEEAEVEEIEADTSTAIFNTKANGLFLSEYYAARDLVIPEGYRGPILNLMQRYVVSRLVRERYLGNWSGTGAGKTLAAVVASRAVDARMTIICCPNAVVDMWREVILSTFPDSTVATKTAFPEMFGEHNYCIWNYEMLQTPHSYTDVRDFVDTYAPAIIVIDEVHLAKQSEKVQSIRCGNVRTLVKLAQAANPEVYRLGTSATPVINNLKEGNSLIEMITGEATGLPTKATVNNGQSLYARVIKHGVRWMPQYQSELIEEVYDIDVSKRIPELLQSKYGKSPLAIERILTEERLPVIVGVAKQYKKTLIYTDLINGGIKEMLQFALEREGLSVGFYTGDDKDGLDQFINGDLNVLIGTSAIGTGVDGLQHVCDCLIMNVLPWTAAAFTQIKGRIYRQGQLSKKVRVVIPATYMEGADGERRSWCQYKLGRMSYKRDLAAMAIDGVISLGKLQEGEAAWAGLQAWMKSLDRQLERAA